MPPVLEHWLPQSHGHGAENWVPAPVPSHFSPWQLWEGSGRGSLGIPAPARAPGRGASALLVSRDGEMARHKVL